MSRPGHRAGTEPKPSREADEERQPDDLASSDVVCSLDFCPRLPGAAAALLIYSSRAISVLAAHPSVPDFLLAGGSVGDPPSFTDRQQDRATHSCRKNHHPGETDAVLRVGRDYPTASDEPASR